MTRIEQVSYNGWERCLRMDNGLVELIVTTDVGPRVISCRLGDGQNLFHQRRGQQGRTGDAEWLIYGGHRLWHSPQVGERPNQPDNRPIEYKIAGETLSLLAEPEAETKVQKRLDITLFPDEARVLLRHRICNRGLWPITLAPWALTVMREGGSVILPIPRNDTLYMPNYAISFWPWTNHADPRFRLGEKFIRLRQDPAESVWFKIGCHNPEGWGAYYLEGSLFVKESPLQAGAEYPDFGSSFETYTDEHMIELESLGPLAAVEPGEWAVHDEQWHLLSGVTLPNDDRALEEAVAARIRALLGKGGEQP